MRVDGGEAAYIAGNPTSSQGVIGRWEDGGAGAATSHVVGPSVIPPLKDELRLEALASLTGPMPLMALRVSGDSFVFEAVNAAFEVATGLSASALIGKRVEQALPLCDVDLALSLCRQCVETLEPIRIRPPPPAKRRYPRFAMTLTPVRGESGDAIVILGCAYPLSDSKKRQVAAVESGDQGPSVDAPPPIIQFTTFESGWPDRIGASFFSYAGLPFDAPPDRLFGAMHPDDRIRVATQARLSPDPASSVCVDARIRRSDGAWRWFRIRAELIDGFSGRRWYGVATEYGVAIDVHQLTPRPESPLGIGDPPLDAPSPNAGRAVHDGSMRVADQCPTAFAGVGCAEDLAWAAGGSVELLEGICDAVAADVALLDAEARIVWANAPCRDSMCELEPVVGVGDPYIDLCRGLIGDFDARALERGLEDVAEGREACFSYVYLDSRSPALRWRQLRVTRLTIGGDVRLIALQEDLTEASEAQAALCSIGEQLLSAQERERQRIAVELHDSTSQHLVALGLGITRLRRVMGKSHQTLDVLDDMSKSLQEAVKEVRVLSYLMKPPGLERDGLRATLEAFVRGFGSRSGLRITLHTDGEIDDVDLEVSHAAYRVVQEALSNVYRHAEARSVDIWVVRRMTTLRLRIADDGRGMARASQGEGEQVLLGVGIPGMRARIAQLGGRLSIHSDGSGTVVTAVTPAVARTQAGENRGSEAHGRTVKIPPSRVN